MLTRARAGSYEPAVRQHRDEDVLRALLRRVTVTENAVRHSEHDASEALVEKAQCVGVALVEATDEKCVVDRLGHSRMIAGPGRGFSVMPVVRSRKCNPIIDTRRQK